ncbi:MAG: YciI family protein [Gemmatimonadota bacterium]
MKYMVVVKASENQGMPPQELFAAIDQLGVDATKAGVQVDTGGLLPSAMGARVRIADRKLIITDGPFTETKELIGGFAIYNVASKQEALEWTKRFMDLHLKHWPEWEGEAEIRQMYEAAGTS